MSIDDIKQEDTGSQEMSEHSVEEDRFSAFAEVNTPVTPQKKKRLHARTRGLIAAIAVAVSLAVILSLLIIFVPSNIDDDSSSDPTSDSTSDEAPAFVLFDKSNVNIKTAVVQSVDFNNQTGKYTIVYDADSEEYFIKGYEDLSLSQNANDLIDMCISLAADDKVKNAGSLKDFGFDKPLSSVTVTYYDGSKTTINIGDLVATEDGHYLNISGSNDVYMVVSDTANLFLAADWWYVSTTLVTSPSVREGDEDGYSIIKDMTISGKNHDVTLKIRRPLPQDGNEFSYYKYVTTSPFLRGVNDSVGDSLYGFKTLYAERAAFLHPTAAQRKEFGFDDPYSVIEFTMAIEIVGDVDATKNEVSDKSYYNNVKHKITVGCKDTSGNYVVMVDDINAIFLVSPDSLKLMAERQVPNTIISLLFLKNIDEMSQIILRDGDKTYKFELAHYPEKEEGNDKLKVKMDGKSYDTANFRSLYVLMMGLQRYGKIDSCPTGKADMSLEFRLLDGSVYLGVDFYRQSGSLYKARTSDGEIFSITANSVNTLISQTEVYLTGQAVVS